jgi:hypothetical protein
VMQWALKESHLHLIIYLQLALPCDVLFLINCTIVNRKR